MFEKHREKKAAEAYQQALGAWQAQHDGYAHLIEVARGFSGAASNEILLKANEALFFKVTNTALVEERAGKGHFEGSSQGLSIPVGSIHGRSVRYRVGTTKGHYVQGAPVPTAIDKGTLFITNQRVIFQGARQTRECAFAKLIGFTHDDSEGSTTFSVSNRQKPTTIFYGPSCAMDVDFRIDLALAHFQGTVAELVADLMQDLAQIDAQRPSVPAGMPA